MFKIPFLGREAVVKERFAKGYRHPDLDKKLRQSRTQSVRERRGEPEDRRKRRGEREEKEKREEEKEKRRD